VVNPVELISKSQRRLARLAALEVLLSGAVPLVITLGLGFSIDIIGSTIQDHTGLVLDSAHAVTLRQAIFIVAAIEALALAFFAWRAWRRENDFIAAARRIDEHVGARQEIWTLATLADPAVPTSREGRTPLFPMLWRRAISYLDMFEPRREFRLAAIEPLRRGAWAALALVGVFAVMIAALTRPPTVEQALAHELRQFARSLVKSSPSSADRQISEAARDVARDLENPKLPPEQKNAELQALKTEIEKYQARKTLAQSGSGNSSGGSGKGSGGGDSSGTGTGKGSGGSGTGAGAGKGGGGKNGPTDQQMVELRNDISRAQMKMETASNAGDKSQTAARNDEGHGSGLAPQPGDNPKQPGPRNQPGGSGNVPVPQPTTGLAQNQAPASGAPGDHRHDQGSHGDTHLGDMPKSVAYQHFYKLGEKGPPIEIRDARYVVFRVPTAVVAPGDGGRLVADPSHPSAAAPYTNAPLKEDRTPASPDEQQLIPPRYRALLP
jgi:hypothetical protein